MIVWLLRSVIVVTALLHLTKGDIPYAVFGFAGVALAFIPEILLRTQKIRFPIELELVLLAVIIADMTFGRLIGLYDRLSWYDKALHGSDSFLIAMVAFLTVYAMHFTGRTRPHLWLDGVLILLITLGLGAVWEIGEYAVDHLLHRATQGAPTMEKLDDTMTDLMADGLGGVLAAVLGSLYIRHSKRSEM